MTRTKLQPISETVGPFKGMRSTMQGSVDPAYAEWLLNCYSSDPYEGGEIVPRPGRRPWPTGGGNHVDANITTPTAVQMFERASFNGAERVVAIIGGKFYSTVTGPWAESLTAAQLSGAGITLSDSATYYACEYRGKLIVCGSTVAFSWDGTAGGGVTELTAAGATFYGRPWVYAAKLWFITGDRASVIWSEENDETASYVGTGNAWDLNQTSFSQLTAGIGTNEALYYFRTDGIGSIYGGSADEFQTTSTHDAVSSTEGTDMPIGVLEAGEYIWYFDAQGRPSCFQKGSRDTIPIWREMARAFTPYTDDGSGYAYLARPGRELASFLDWATNNKIVYLRSLEMVFFAYRHFFSAAQPTSAFDVLVGYNVRTRKIQTVWEFPTPIAGVVEIKDQSFGTGDYQLVILDNLGYSYAVNANNLMGRNLGDEAWADADSSTDEDEDVVCSVVGPRHFLSVGTELRVTRLDFEYIGRIIDAEMGVRFATSSILAQLGVTIVDATGSNDGDLRTQGIVETVVLEGVVEEGGTGFPPLHTQATVGYEELCRWIAFGFSWAHQASGGVRLVRYKVTAVPDSDQPEQW
jgi:hypothetical protein